jgi:hypothetical protein
MDRNFILNNWEQYTPHQIVNLFTESYPNKGSRSSLLSSFKSSLKKLNSPPSNEYLSSLALGKNVYEEINTSYSMKKQEEGFNIKIIPNVGRAVLQAINNINSNDINELWPSVILCSGFRPIEVLTSTFKPFNLGSIPHKDFYILVSGLAKKRGTEEGLLRQHPLLCPGDKWLKAVERIKGALPIQETNAKTLQKYGRLFLKWTKEAYPYVPKITNTLNRKLYSMYAYYSYRNDYPGIVDRLTFINYILGHNSMSSSSVYNLVDFDINEIINIFEIEKTPTYIFTALQ